MKTLSRRQLLKASALLPFLPAALARAAPLPFTPARNLVVLFHPNGLEPGWKPSVVSGQLVLPPVLSALEPFASKLLCVHGLKNGVRNEVRAHAEGMAGMFTGALIPKNDAYSAWPSFDQLIAEQVGRDAPFPSRLPGWIAQWREMLEHKLPISRPRQIYTGHTVRPYIPMGNR